MAVAAHTDEPAGALDTGSPMFRPTVTGGPKLVGVDLATDTVVRTIVFPPGVALPTTYLNDVRFDLRRGADGIAFITDSPDQGPNGIIVVGLATGESWRRLHEHPSTKAEPLTAYRPVVEGRYLMQRPPDGEPQPLTMGADGTYETLIHDPRLLWPDTMSVAADGHLYVTANQLHRQPAYQHGNDPRQKPYALFRTPIDAGPVRLRRQ